MTDFVQLNPNSRKAKSNPVGYMRSGPEDCWPWTGGSAPTGHGIFRHPDTWGTVAAHRYVYEMLVGPIPEGHDLHHCCENPPCCNPAHLEPLTKHDHVHRSPRNPCFQQARQTHCKRGHSLADDSPHLYFTKSSKRSCRTCNNDHKNQWRAENRSESREYHRLYMRARRARQKLSQSVNP